jgi:hypothetical protein
LPEPVCGYASKINTIFYFLRNGRLEKNSDYASSSGLGHLPLEPSKIAKYLIFSTNKSVFFIPPFRNVWLEPLAPSPRPLGKTSTGSKCGCNSLGAGIASS